MSSACHRQSDARSKKKNSNAYMFYKMKNKTHTPPWICTKFVLSHFGVKTGVEWKWVSKDSVRTINDQQSCSDRSCPNREFFDAKITFSSRRLISSMPRKRLACITMHSLSSSS